MKLEEITQALLPAPLREAFGGEVDAEQLARVLLEQGEAVLRKEFGSVDARVRTIELVFSGPEALPEELRAYADEEDKKIVDVHLYVSRTEELYHLIGSFSLVGAVAEGTIDICVREKPKLELPNWTWREVFERTGVTMPAEFEHFAALAAKDGVRRAMRPAHALMEVESFLRPDQLPFLRTTAGDYLVLRFDGKSGAPLDYALVVHDDLLTHPMGESLPAALKYLAATELKEWGANADAIAGASIGYFEEVRVALDLMYEWDHWKFKLKEGPAANSEALCREWLGKWDALDVSVLRKNAGCQTITAFAAARLGATERAVNAAVAALRLPARDGDWRRYALRLMEELRAEVPADLKTLCDCLRSSKEISEVLKALEVAAHTMKQTGDHEGAYELLLRASYDYSGTEEKQLVDQLLQAARAAGYGPVAAVLASRLEFPL